MPGNSVHPFRWSEPVLPSSSAGQQPEPADAHRKALCTSDPASVGMPGAVPVPDRTDLQNGPGTGSSRSRMYPLVSR